MFTEKTLDTTRTTLKIELCKLIFRKVYLNKHGNTDIKFKYIF